MEAHYVFYQKPELGHRLRYSSLVLFLELLHHRAIRGWHQSMIQDVVENLMEEMMLIDKHKWNKGIADADEAGSSKDLRPFLHALHMTIAELYHFQRRNMELISEAHGPIGDHGSMEALMEKVGACVDRAALKILCEQVFAVHASYLASSNSHALKSLEEVHSVIGKALSE